ncbi:MAG: phosphoribosyltransferase-like protein [Christensenellales bacterium]
MLRNSARVPEYARENYIPSLCMRIIDVLNDPKCSGLFSEINEFAHDSLCDYNDSIQRDGFFFLEKDISDFVWGTVEASAPEVCVLDSPILQRLRRIRQLGMASVVYCNADHSRFSHTIGVLEIAGKMASVITKKLNKSDSTVKSGGAVFHFEEIVRFAALFHDAGHLFFSHVSEAFFTYCPRFARYAEITKIKSHFSEQTSSFNALLHELFSVMIVNAGETKRLIKLIAPHLKSRLSEDKHIDQFLEYVSCLIIGVPVDNHILPYCKIIKSKYDANKLDYLSRDSACTKVPIAVDIAQIIRKIDVAPYEGDPDYKIWNHYADNAGVMYEMDLKNIAKKVTWHLTIARSMIFESVYNHHKVLTANTMFQMALDRICQDFGPGKLKFSYLLKITDQYFGEYFMDVLVDKDRREGKNCAEAAHILSLIRDRRLYKRAASFTRSSMISPVYISKTFINQVVKNPYSRESAHFRLAMQEEYAKIRKIMGKTETSKSPVFMFIVMDELGSAPTETGGSHAVKSEAKMIQEAMDSGRKSQQEQFYLVTDMIDREHVYLALEKVMSSYNIRLTKESCLCAKFSQDTLNEIRNRLLEAGYYNDSLYLLPDEMFVHLFRKKLFDRVVEKYQCFHGAGNCKVNEKRLYAFLKQFSRLQYSKGEIESILDGVLRILNEALFIERENFVSEASALLQQIPVKKGGKNYVLPLGGRLDSSMHLSYYFNDIKLKHDYIYPRDLESILPFLTPGDKLVFLDDGAYSGRQVISIFQEYMGVPKNQRTTNENHVNELSEENKEKLKNANITLVYVCFNSQSENTIRRELNDLGLDTLSILYTHDLSEMKIFDGKKSIFKDARQKELLRSCLYDKGKEILQKRNCLEDGTFKDRWSMERIENAALGYNNAQQMVVFEFNIPTYSLCAFWTTEKDDELVWKGLFQRTLKE